MVGSFSAGSTTRDTASREAGGLGGGQRDGGGTGSFTSGLATRQAYTRSQQIAIARAAAENNIARTGGGGQTGFEGSPELGGRGTVDTYGFDQSGPAPSSLSFWDQLWGALRPGTPGGVQGPESQNVLGRDGAGDTQGGGGMLGQFGQAPPPGMLGSIYQGNPYLNQPPGMSAGYGAPMMSQGNPQTIQELYSMYGVPTQQTRAQPPPQTTGPLGGGIQNVFRGGPWRAF